MFRSLKTGLRKAEKPRNRRFWEEVKKRIEFKHSILDMGVGNYPEQKGIN